MCGIIGCVSNKNNVIEALINGLTSLEYRGYDSAGIAVIENNNIIIKKEVGKLNNLKNKVDFSIKSNIGIGHTRWATHGKVSIDNSHPHQVGKFTIVHNGIIENYLDLKKQLTKKGYSFKSETDTEVVAALLDDLYKNNNILNTLRIFQEKIKGSYALGIIIEDEKDTIYAVKNKSPLIVGIGNNSNFLASDVTAIIKYTNKYSVLDDGNISIITKDKVILFDNNLNLLEKDIKTFNNINYDLSKGNYKHYMIKEIFEQTSAVKNTIDLYLNDSINSLNKTMPNFSKYNKIIIVGCGSAMHAGLIGKYLIENYGNIPVEVFIASEFRYNKLFIDKKTLVIGISQSGETADTLAAIDIAKKYNADTLGIINRKDSSMSRNVKYVLYTMAGVEQAVATTKAYLCQLAILSLIALKLGYNNDIINNYDSILQLYKNIDKVINVVLDNYNIYKNIAKKIYKKEHLFFIGRDVDYYICMEGSLKLKEISYIHSEAYAAGELKHGTIALIDDKSYVIAVLTNNRIKEKTISNIKEVKSRGAKVILLTNSKITDNDIYDELIKIPESNGLLESLLAVIPLQCLAYECALLNNCDIDKPKNLAKSVTVE